MEFAVVFQLLENSFQIILSHLNRILTLLILFTSFLSPQIDWGQVSHDWMTEDNRSEQFADNLRKKQEHNTLEAADILDNIKNVVNGATTYNLEFAEVEIDL